MPFLLLNCSPAHVLSAATRTAGSGPMLLLAIVAAAVLLLIIVLGKIFKRRP